MTNPNPNPSPSPSPSPNPSPSPSPNPSPSPSPSLSPSPLAERTLPSPVGVLRLIASERGLVAVLFPDHVRPPSLVALASDEPHPVLDRAAAQLGEYFAGRRREFDVPLDPRGTPFQQEVWAALAAIPWGETRSYVDIARQLGRPSASRAVGAANGKNPLSILVPCHRVIATSGALTGYAGGMSAKRWLLEHEGRG